MQHNGDDSLESFMFNPPPPKIVAFFLDNVERYGRARNATGNIILRRKYLICMLDI
jgi:hypothetical protein